MSNKAILGLATTSVALGTAAYTFKKATKKKIRTKDILKAGTVAIVGTAITKDVGNIVASM